MNAAVFLPVRISIEQAIATIAVHRKRVACMKAVSDLAKEERAHALRLLDDVRTQLEVQQRHAITRHHLDEGGVSFQDDAPAEPECFVFPYELERLLRLVQTIIHEEG